MRCYNCGCELTEHKFCTNCGVDVVRYKKIIRTSNYFYNQGLERAKVRDLSGAVVSLHQSLKFNKNNIKARNLLGLIYIETGEVAAAISEWVVSKNLKPKKNMASDYLEMIETNKTKLDTLNQAIAKYNQGLEYAKQDGGVDMAIIQLKRAVSLNPKHLRAHQLLALCYIQDRKPEAARRELEKCKAIDVNNTITLRYITAVNELLNPADEGKKKDKASKEAETLTYVVDNETIIQPIGHHEKKGASSVLNILFGLAIGFAVAFFLVLPARISKERGEAQNNVKVIGAQLDAKNLELNELQKKDSEQTAQIAALTETLNKYNGTEGTLLSMENLLKAASVYLDSPDNFLEVADYISTVDEAAWTEDTSDNYKNLYYALKTAIGPKVSAAYYKDGSNLYKSGQYEDAVSYFEAAVFFDNSNADALFQLGVTYGALDRIDEAITVYNKVIAMFPNSSQANKAASAVKKLNSGNQ